MWYPSISGNINAWKLMRKIYYVNLTCTAMILAKLTDSLLIWLGSGIQQVRGLSISSPPQIHLPLFAPQSLPALHSKMLNSY